MKREGLKPQIQAIMGDLVRKMRKNRGISQAELARRVEHNRSFISRIEKGQRDIGFVLLGKIAAALDCFIDIEMIPIEEDLEKEKP